MNPIYLDVRTPDEFKTGHYPNAINHDVNLLTSGILPDIDKNAEIKVYCRSGGRAAMAQQILQQHGFMNVENIGGYQP